MKKKLGKESRILNKNNFGRKGKNFESKKREINMNPLKTVRGTIISGFVLAIILMLASSDNHLVGIASQSAMIWAHVLAGITWIGLLYYFNFNCNSDLRVKLDWHFKVTQRFN